MELGAVVSAAVVIGGPAGMGAELLIGSADGVTCHAFGRSEVRP